MPKLLKRPWELSEREVTDEALYLRRRDFLRQGAAAAGALAAVGLLPGCGSAQESADASVALPAPVRSGPYAKLERVDYASGEEPTPFDKASRYNNFYEFGTDKEDPASNAGSLRTDPWSVEVGGLVAKPGRVPLEDLLSPHAKQERIYRLRCVEAWSMVIPWVGIPLADVIKRLEPAANAKYVEFRTLLDPEQMPGQRRSVLDWPYREGLRIDEAMNPLTLLAVGMYGRELPNQNGAPLRLVVPWKYGFKSIKSIVSIKLTESQPDTSWNLSAPREYGFFSNVNPEVDHPRWSQARERRIGEFRRRKTLPFNGYAEQVAHLYGGMDLRKFF